MIYESWWKANLGSSMFNKLVAIVLVFSVPLSVMANPQMPGKFTFVEEASILEEIGITPGPAWCYNAEANATLITAPAREKANCELKLMYELEKQSVKHKFEVDRLQLSLDTAISKNNEILIIKNQEIEKLTEAALKRPNDNNIWWGAGGFVAGSAMVVLIGWLVISANSGFGN